MRWRVASRSRSTSFRCWSSRDRPTGLTHSDLGIPEGFLFMFCYDALSVLGRKNPGAVIDAFQRAFPTEGEALLLLKSINGEQRGADLERLRGSVAGRRDVQILDEYWPYQHVAALMQLCGCYVSLHRSEGFGLTLAPAMAQGRPVIGTSYSGNLAFMERQEQPARAVRTRERWSGQRPVLPRGPMGRARCPRCGRSLASRS